MLTQSVASALLASLWCLPSAQAQQSITVPAGTVIPLTLVNPIKSKSTRPGDLVRASVAFPITVGDQVAIPSGTYVEGTLSPPAPKVKHKPDPGVQVHFTRLVFANGYSAPFDAMQAATLPLALPATDSSHSTTALLAGLNTFSAFNSLDFTNIFSLPSQWRSWRLWLMSPQIAPPTPVTPTLSRPGPSPGIFIGVAAGIAAATLIVGVLFRHNNSSRSDFIVHDAGWQFQMKLETPLTLDLALLGSKIP